MGGDQWAATQPTTVTVDRCRDGSWAGADVIAIGVRPGSPALLDPAGDHYRLGERYQIDLAAVVTVERVAGRAGEVVRVPVQAPEGQPSKVLLVGVGSGSAQDLRRAGAALARAVRGRAQVVTSLADGLKPDAVRALTEGLLLGGYALPALGVKSRGDNAAVREVVLTGDVPVAAVEAGRVHALATIRARDLAAMPSNTKSPAWFVEEAVRVAQTAGLAVRIWDEDDLAADGFGGLLAVGAGSVTPPRLVRLDYEPAGGGRRAGHRSRVVLVGKGVTFDTGGLSIKSREAMLSMKTDMAGAAAVLAVLAACPSRGIARPVTGLLALAENAFGGASYRPSDIVRPYGGPTVEVTNTDAEGRLVLADALAYADTELDPDVVVDLATLTGAVTLGLGRRHAALFTSDDRLAAGLEAASAVSGEGVWRLPLVEEYRAVLDSSVADVRHLAADRAVGAGAIVAALFLREFVGRRRWAHLDIAGTGRADKDEYEVTRGATGYGARLVLRWLESLR